ncbi:MAG: copper chaperone [Sphingobacteriales bacterium]|nr:MAG: copper chaperone [Sphingobacteriales bacterium]
MRHLFSFFACILLVTTIQAQVKKGNVTVTIKTPTVQCESCKTRIENYLAREEGVFKVVSDYKRKTVKVTFYTDRTNIENIKTAIANIGYDADDVTADPEAYKKLPLCCKKPEDGGGMKKKG